jgi:hypothetical protein
LRSDADKAGFLDRAARLLRGVILALPALVAGIVNSATNENANGGPVLYGTGARCHEHRPGEPFSRLEYPNEVVSLWVESSLPNSKNKKPDPIVEAYQVNNTLDVTNSDHSKARLSYLQVR